VSAAEPSKARWLALQQDQYWIQFDASIADNSTLGQATPEPSPEAWVKRQVQDTAYVTDQSDSWLQLVIAGSGTQAALERICPLDIDSQAFQIGDVARTSMEHMSVVMVRLAETQWQLLSPRSTAGTFVHALELSIHNAC